MLTHPMNYDMYFLFWGKMLFSRDRIAVIVCERKLLNIIRVFGNY